MRAIPEGWDGAPHHRTRLPTRAALGDDPLELPNQIPPTENHKKSNQTVTIIFTTRSLPLVGDNNGDFGCTSQPP